MFQIKSKDNAKPKGLKGISDAQIEPHFEKHYKGYVAKLNEGWQKWETIDRTKANQNLSDVRTLKVEESWNWMGTVLHELYFENLKTNTGQINTALNGEIEEIFGSWDKFKQDFVATGTALKGWAVLVLDLTTGRLMINGLDAHNVGGFLNAIPILVLDVYEHAYYIDQGPVRAKYIDAFFENINWDVVNKRYEKAKKAYAAVK